MRNKLFKESFNAKKLRESDKPAPKSIEDCQKWIDYDMKHYGKISERTNEIIKKAGFQIIKDDHGDYEVTAGKYESLKEDIPFKNHPNYSEAKTTAKNLLNKHFNKNLSTSKDIVIENIASFGSAIVGLIFSLKTEPDLYYVYNTFEDKVEVKKANEITVGKYDESCKKEELKEAMSEKESKVAEIISQLKDMDSSHFYTALMIYELLDIERPTEALIEAIEDYVDDLETIYDDYVRDEVRIIAEEFDGDKEVKDEVRVETEVEEKLGEFKKPEHKDSSKDFEYKD